MRETKGTFSGKHDSEKAKHHVSYGHEFEGRDEIDNLFNMMRVVFDLEKHSVILKHSNPKNLGGEILYKTKEIFLYPIGHNAGVLLHEIAHIPGKAQAGHGPRFHEAQDIILEVYEEVGDLVEHSYTTEVLEVILNSIEEEHDDILKEAKDYVEDWNEDGKNIDLDRFVDLTKKFVDLRAMFSAKSV